MNSHAGDHREMCPACSSSSFSSTSISDRPFSICHNCDCVFANPVTEDSFDYAEGYLGQGVDLSAALTEVENQKARITAVQRFTPAGTLWDIGSGPGYLVKAARMMGWEAVGCELSRGCCDFACDTLDVPVYCMSYEGLPGATGMDQVDVVTAYHVLEHLTSPREFAGFCSRVLRPGGLLVVEIPNLFSFESLHDRDAWVGLALPSHVGFYTPKSLEALFTPAFRIVAIEHSIAQYFYDKIADYIQRLAVNPDLIDESARQFSGTILVAYLERNPDPPAPRAPWGKRVFGRTLPYRAGRRVFRAVKGGAATAPGDNDGK